MPHHDAPPKLDGRGRGEVGNLEIVENDPSRIKGARVGEDVLKIVETRWAGQWLVGCSMYDVDDERRSRESRNLKKKENSVRLHT